MTGYYDDQGNCRSVMNLFGGRSNIAELKFFCFIPSRLAAFYF